MLTWLGPVPYLVVTDPQTTQDILTSPHCVNKATIYNVFEDNAGIGLINLKDKQWSTHRKLLNPIVGFEMLQGFQSVFNRETDGLLEKLDKLVNDGEKDLSLLVQMFTLDMGIENIMCVGTNEKKDYDSKIMVQHLIRISQTSTDMALCPWLRNRTIRQILGKEKRYADAKSGLREFLKKMIKQKLDKDNAANQPSAVTESNKYINLSTDLLKRGIFSSKNVEDEAFIILFAIFDTSANSLIYTLMLLAMFPVCQEKVFQELKSLFPENGVFEVTFASTHEMVYLDMVMNECFRLFSPAPIVFREASQDIRLSNGVIIPKGLQIAIDIFHMQRSKTIWGPDAETFNPDHFLPANMQDIHPYAFIPFTKGIRYCLGTKYAMTSLKVTLAKILRKYKFSTSMKFEDLHYTEQITLGLKTTPLFELQRRY
ncbi:probable cytochrome P450 313a4 [Scaptodrosophila lebanonensis]|uniref:Probable cytochrome P450 313a4 n=1 Tax=Drosophila lebanonensis TaxID=7225 RepID=A0A6J2UDN7_DROLE|nr:probable cytochrome P450 313a4 [Scaptodrosophila lebanonensis]